MKRSTVQVNKDGESSQVNELYEGSVLEIEERDDQLLFTLRCNNIGYRAEGKYTFTCQVTYDAEARPIKGSRYAINRTMGECKAGDQVMVWNVSIDNDEVGHPPLLLSLTLTLSLSLSLTLTLTLSLTLTFNPNPNPQP